MLGVKPTFVTVFIMMLTPSKPKGGLGREHGALRPDLSLASCVLSCKEFFSNAKW